VVEKLKEGQAAARSAPGLAGIRGVLRDAEGNPPAGAYAYASTDPNLMIGVMPRFRSLPVGEDGVYFIDLPKGGTYYVGARSGFGGPPMPGQWHGFFGGEAPAPVVVENGKVAEGVDVTVKEME
jgi:hypothetical protein